MIKDQVQVNKLNYMLSPTKIVADLHGNPPEPKARNINAAQCPSADKHRVQYESELRFFFTNHSSKGSQHLENTSGVRFRGKPRQSRAPHSVCQVSTDIYAKVHTGCY